MACVKLWKVNVMAPGTGARFEYIEAVNPPEARRFAEARYPGCRIGSVNSAR